ncbi:LysR family transcriptional regulator [Maritimibacter sp. 55A14]|uniref:LysR family transcriptional regulator n=1 Tax=Maritimibacter sp. 55A14 TaxID=2174844 RepID=UPI000D61E6E5|nr:LysR family transcriptional regulator [Maritimibacter sp. 55A14]PWE33741.1 LysR family transcriptional regulator [Maritimibacter sp. 55A14]
MPRNLDMTALRSFVTVADAGGVTRAASLLHLTQSAVSMQLKRLEESLELQLLDRSARRIALTAAGEQLLGYGKRMLALNDEVWARLTHQEFEGEVLLGVPDDIVYPYIPKVLKRFNAEYPRVRVNLISSYTRRLKDLHARGECDVILATEAGCDNGGETLDTRPLLWMGAPGGSAWKSRPLRLAFEHGCIFRQRTQEALDAAGIPWEMAVESDRSRSVEASVTADLAVHAGVAGTTPPYIEEVDHGGALPDLGHTCINLYGAGSPGSGVGAELAAMVRQAYCCG